MLGESMTFQVGFDNASATDTGYGPFLDVVLPATGKDGNDGITFQSASYLGSSLTATVLTFDAAGHAVHPLAKTSTGTPVIVSGTPGDQLVVLQLPFGSFTPDQPTATVDVKAMVSPLADVDQALNIQATGGFALGNDRSTTPRWTRRSSARRSPSTASPALLKLTKTYLGPENETATGPSYHQQYLITVDVAAGQTVTNLDVTDLLPANLQFVSVVQTAGPRRPTATTAISTPSTTTPGGTLTRRFASVTGDASNPTPPCSSSSTSRRTTRAATRSCARCRCAGDVGGPGELPGRLDAGRHARPRRHVHEQHRHAHPERPVAGHPEVGPGRQSHRTERDGGPGDTLEYTIVFQVSDFFALQSLVVSDVISDGQRFDTTFTPTLLITATLTTSRPATSTRATTR